MNKDYITWNLMEAKKEIEQTLRDIKVDPEFECGDLMPSMQHLFHHVNTAWNARNASPEEVKECSQENFERWRQFPMDIDMDT